MTEPREQDRPKPELCGDKPARSVANRVRFVAGYAWAAASTVFFALAYGLAHLITKDPDVFRFWASGWGRSLLFGFGVRVDPEIRAKLDPRGSYVFVSNHQNLLDIPMLAAILPCPFGFVAKAELEDVPFLGFALRTSPSVFVESRDPRRSLESLRVAGEQIRGGRSVIIFPEGARTWSADLIPFKKSGFQLAAEAGVPVVPITIVDSYRLMQEQHHLSRPGRVRVVVHESMAELPPTRRTELNAFMKRVESVIASELGTREAVRGRRATGI